MLDNWIELLGFLSSVFQVGQSEHQHANDLRWSEIDWHIQRRQMRLDSLNNAREDIEDRFNKDQQNLDSNLLVATLMLGIGFGFVIEAPSAELSKEPDGPIELWLHRIYVVVSGLSIIFPFLSVLSFWECRHILIEFMKIFHEQYYQRIKRYHAQGSVIVRNNTSSLPLNFGQFLVSLVRCGRRNTRAVTNNPQGQGEGEVLEGEGEGEGEGIAPSSNQQTSQRPPQRPPDDHERVLIAWPKAYNEWWEKKVRRWSKAALAFLYLAMHCNMLCCALLLGFYFEHKFKNEVMWMSWASVVMFGWLVSLCISWWFLIEDNNYGNDAEATLLKYEQAHYSGSAGKV